jgi:hypothetical protein
MQRPGGMQGGPGGMQGQPGMQGGPGGMQGQPGMQGGESPIGKLGTLSLGIVTVDVTGTTVALETTGTFPNEQIAKDALADLVEQKKKASVGLLALALTGNGPPKQVTEAFNKATMDVSGNQIIIKGAIEITPDLIKQAFPDNGPGPNGGRSKLSRLVLDNNFKQLGLAFHNYASSHNSEFPAVFSPKGKPFSWRVALLPYIEEEGIYNKLHLDEAWDSPHNLEVAKSMTPRCYKPVDRTSNPGETYVKTFTGVDTIFGQENVTSFKKMAKGSSNTILFVEAEKPVIWTKPEEIAYTPNLDFIAELFWLADQTTVTMADGGIRRIKKSNPNEEFHNTINQKIQKPAKLD